MALSTSKSLSHRWDHAVSAGQLFSALADEFSELGELHCSAAVYRSDCRYIQLQALNVSEQIDRVRGRRRRRRCIRRTGAISVSLDQNFWTGQISDQQFIGM